MHRPTWFLIVLACSSIVAVGCGSDAGGGSSDGKGSSDSGNAAADPVNGGVFKGLADDQLTVEFAVAGNRIKVRDWEFAVFCGDSDEPEVKAFTSGSFFREGDKVVTPKRLADSPDQVIIVEGEFDGDDRASGTMNVQPFESEGKPCRSVGELEWEVERVKGTDAGFETGSDVEVPKPGDQLLSNDFAKETSNWTVGDDDGFSTSYADGGFLLSSETAEFKVNSKVDVDEEDTSDAHVTATAWFTPESAELEDGFFGNSLGVTCRTTALPSPHYELGFTSHRTAEIQLWSEKQDLEVLAAMRLPDSFDPTDRHELVADCNGSDLTLEIDGKHRLHTTDDTLTDGTIALALYSEAADVGAMFDDVTVSRVS